VSTNELRDAVENANRNAAAAAAPRRVDRRTIERFQIAWCAVNR
jgi:hypothetical protein